MSVPILNIHQIVALLTLLGDEKTIALFERDSVSVRKSVSIAVSAPKNPNFHGRCESNLIARFHLFSRAQNDSVPGVLVVGREPRWVGRLGDFGAVDLLERVDALALGIESVHKMHDWRYEVVDSLGRRVI